MAHTISGTLGPSGAGTSVFFSSSVVAFPQVGPTAIADASGNFVSGPLPDNATYKVTPVMFGAEFSPAVRSIALVTSNITGVNWSGVSYYHLSIPGNSDTFNRGGVTQNPILGWDTEGASALQVVSDSCRATTLNAGQGASGGLPQNYAPPADQYGQHDFAVCTDLSQLGVLGVRKNVARTLGIHCEWGTILNLPFSQPNGGGAVQIADLTLNTSLFSSPGFVDVNTPLYNFNTGDVLLFVALGNNFYAFLKQSGNIIPMAGAVSASTPLANRPGIELSAVGSVSNIAVKNWAAGSVLPGALGNATTASVMWGTFFGPSLSAAFSNPFGLDILQIKNEGGAVVWNLDKNGVANINPISPTAGSLNVYFGSSFIQAAGFNPQSLDVFQVIGQGGKIVFSVDFQGNAGSH